MTRFAKPFIYSLIAAFIFVFPLKAQANVYVCPQAGSLLTRQVWKKSVPTYSPVAIVININQRKLLLIRNGMPVRSYPVAVGKSSTPTPIGQWKVIHKSTNWGTGFGTRWLGLNVPWGIYGIHGTNKPGSIGGWQSHGCIRMFNRHVEELYKQVPLGTTVYIIGNPFTYQSPPYKVLRRGDRGSAVLEIQKALVKQGYELTLDGIWGWQMEKAIIEFRRSKKLPPDNAVDDACYRALHLKK
ncbi:MAG: L,D-transpeptidase family protein [Bacillota bacterium]